LGVAAIGINGNAVDLAAEHVSNDGVPSFMMCDDSSELLHDPLARKGWLTKPTIGV
jgi:hypothetical protein